MSIRVNTDSLGTCEATRRVTFMTKRCQQLTIGTVTTNSIVKRIVDQDATIVGRGGKGREVQ